MQHSWNFNSTLELIGDRSSMPLKNLPVITGWRLFQKTVKSLAMWLSVRWQRSCSGNRKSSGNVTQPFAVRKLHQRRCAVHCRPPRKCGLSSRTEFKKPLYYSIHLFLLSGILVCLKISQGFWTISVILPLKLFFLAICRSFNYFFQIFIALDV